MRNLFLFIVLITFASCKTDTQVAIHDLQPFTGENINVVVEIPAGTNHKIEYNHASDQFVNDQIDGKDRVIQFLPYPGNYGFVPGTLMDKNKGGDGDALDILVLGPSVPTASVLQVKLIGALLLKDGGEIDTKLIAIPLENATIKANSFIDFALKYDAARRIIEDWFLNYKGQGVMEMIRWEDESFAREEIKRWGIDK